MKTHEFIPGFPDVGFNLNRERKARHLSLDALASASAVSKAMLSQIETGKVNPTVGTVWKIAHALNVDMDVLLSGSTAKSTLFEVTRKENIPTLTTDTSCAVFRVLSPVSMAEKLELYIVTLAPGSIHSSNPHCEGTEELLTILSGEVRITSGESSDILRPGDTIRYKADRPHSMENVSKDTPAELHMTVLFR